MFVVLLAGPTGVGKTAVSLELAERLNAEIVNADSMQVYRLLDIGTAKPSPEQRERIAHHLIDVAYPDEDFDAARYRQTAAPVVSALHKAGKIPLVVGGTGLYMKVLTRGICFGAPSDPAVRMALLAEQEEKGLDALYRELTAVDPPSAARIHPNDRQRIIRALEVFRITSQPLSYWQSQHRFRDSLYRTVKIFLYRDREKLYERINRRADEMLERGFLKEVKSLLDMGYGPELKSMQSIGYRQLVQHLLGEYSLDTAVSIIRKETRRYAKRQITWFRGDQEYHWFHAEDRDGILRWIEKERAQNWKEFS